MCMVGRERGKDKSEQSEDEALSHVTAQSHKGYKMEVRVGGRRTLGLYSASPASRRQTIR